MAPDCIVVRHSSAGVPHQLAKVSKAAIVNAGDGANEHPTQALLDAMTIREHKGKIDGLKSRSSATSCTAASLDRIFIC